VRSSPEIPGIEAAALSQLDCAPIRVVLAEPDTVSCRVISSFLDNEPDVTLEQVDDARLVSSIQRHAPDLVILDAHTPSVREAESWEDLGIKSPPATIVTTYDSNSQSPFITNATDTLTKPFDGERFEEALDLAKSRIVRIRIKRESSKRGREPEVVPSRQYIQRLAVEEEERILLVRTTDIEWIQASGNYVELHVGSNCYVLRQSLKSLQSQLDPSSFLRVHRNAIVNLDHVEEFHLPPVGNLFVKMHQGVSLPLRKSNRAVLRRMLSRIS
jgi:two-component system, LytTR family, response regulator